MIGKEAQCTFRNESWILIKIYNLFYETYIVSQLSQAITIPYILESQFISKVIKNNNVASKIIEEIII